MNTPTTQLENTSNPVKDLVLSALFIALGVIIPQIFHFIGAGPVFLPMHIPVLLCGFFLSWRYALGVGIITPSLSSLITGMPVFFPMLPIMVVELGLYALCISLFYRKLKLNVFIALISAMIIGRIGAGIVVWSLAIGAFKLPPIFNQPVAYVFGAVVTGLPGILIQLILIPVSVLFLTRILKKQHSS